MRQGRSVWRVYVECQVSVVCGQVRMEVAPFRACSIRSMIQTAVHSAAGEEEEARWWRGPPWPSSSVHADGDDDKPASCLAIEEVD